MNKETKLIKWFIEGDVSRSAMSIVGAFYEAMPEYGYVRPHDGSDFGRCIRLIETVPEMMDGVIELSRNFASWQALLENWEGLKLEHKTVIEKGVSDKKLHDIIRDMYKIVDRVGEK